MKRKATRIAVIVATIGVVGVVALKSLPYFIDKNAIRIAIEDGLHKSTGVNFRIQELTLEPTLLHGLQVHLNTSTITDMRHNPLGSIGNITVEIRYLPILLEQLPEIAKIHLNHVHIPVGKYNLFQEIKLKLVKPERTGFLKPAEMRDTEILLTDYVIEDVILADSVRRLYPQARQFRLEGEKMSIRNLESNQPVSLLGNGQLAYEMLATQQPKQTKTTGTQPSQLVRAPISPYRIFIEIPQAALKEGATLSASTLQRLELKLDGKEFKTTMDYRYQKDNTGAAKVRSTGLYLKAAQALALQLSDTVGLPLPDESSAYLLTGRTVIDQDFTLDFRTKTPTLRSATGRVELDNLAVSKYSQWPTPMLSHVRGHITSSGQILQAKNLQFLFNRLPLRLQGDYNLARQTIDGSIWGRNLQIRSLEQTLAPLGVDTQALKGRKLSGLASVAVHLTGPIAHPSFKGLLSLQNGYIEDPSQGLVAQGVNGQIQFNGTGFQNPKIHYQGTIDVQDGSLISKAQGIAVQHYGGQVRFNGAFQPNAKTFELPRYEGHIQVRQAQYQNPETGLLVEGIQGLVRLAENRINLEKFRGLLGGATFWVNGILEPNLAALEKSTYNIHLTSQNIDLPRFKREVVHKLPNADPILQQLELASGHANLDVRLKTGLNFDGRLDARQLALRTGDPEAPIEIPSLAVLFNQKTVTIPQTTMRYGEVAMDLSGTYAQSGAYQADFRSNEIPMSFIREQSDLIALLSGAEIPEIWNTDGRFSANGHVSNDSKNLALHFHQAGLSWKGGDFPVYDINGSLLVQQQGSAHPVIDSRNLAFRYGNSPIQLAVHHQGELDATIEGVLSPLTVNHFLVSYQSSAIPYKQVPFQASAKGNIAGFSEGKSQSPTDLAVHLRMNLNENLQRAFNEAEHRSNQPGASQTPAQPEQAPPPEEKTQANGRRADEDETEEDEGFSINLNPVQAIPQLLGKARETVQTGVGVVTGTVPHLLKTLPIPSLSHATGTEAPSAGAVLQNPPFSTEQLASSAPKSTLDAYLDANLHWRDPHLEINQATLHLFDAGNVLIKGRIEHLPNPEQRLIFAHLLTEPEINLSQLSQHTGANQFFKDVSGTVAANMQFAMDGEGTKLASGWARSNQVAIPYLTVQDISGEVGISGENGIFNISSFKAPGISVHATANTDNIFSVPVALENVQIRGDLLSIDSLSDFNSEIVKPILVDQIAHSFFRPWQQGDPNLPIQFRFADLQLDEVIFQNIIINNLTSRFSVYANGLFELNRTRLEAAGGSARGYLSMNPNDNNFTTLELNAEHIKANALTKALLDVTNEIFGDLSGTVRFTTFGEDDMAMQKNANGSVKMKVENGRLPAIAKVETLLATANVLRGGILGLNLNNLLRSLTIYDTNYFATLQGDMQINNQVLYTENLTSDGVNLDLLIQGSLRMDNGSADMLVTGNMSQDVAGKLGALGQLSLDRLIRLIPGLGTWGTSRAGLFGYIPGVGYVPGLGGPAGNFTKFQVRLDGPLDQPNAIQGFQWLRAEEPQASR